jgi:hypothetical protein
VDFSVVLFLSARDIVGTRMKTVNVQERLREPLRCPVREIDLTETGPGQPVILSCNHVVSTEGVQQVRFVLLHYIARCEYVQHS